MALKPEREGPTIPGEPRGGIGMPLAAAIACLAVHLAVNAAGGYGYFRDEFYYLACADHLDWGYVDHPPLSILLLRLWSAIAGDSLFALRLPAALAGAGTVLLTGLIAREMGGRRFAQGMAALAALAAPMYLAVTGFYSMNAYELVFWALAAFLVARILRTGDERMWIGLGVVLGLGLQNKLSVLWLGAGLAAGLVLTPARRWLLTRWPYLAAGIALLLFLPHVLWQVANAFPTREFMRNAQEMKMTEVRPVEFVSEQVLTMNPVLAPLWAGGLLFLLLAPGGRRFRLLGVIYLAVLALLLVNGRSRASYLSPAYPALFAAGAVWLEGLGGGLARLARPAYAVLVLAAGVALAPLALPVLPVERYIAYAARLGVGPSTDERVEMGALPQFFADMHGWEEMVGTVARVYHSLTPEEQAKAAIFAQNYGEAGAITHLGRPLGLPAAISGHNNFWLWGPGDWTGEVAVVLGGDEADNREVCGELAEAARIDCGHCMPYENHQPVYICRRLKMPPADLWPKVKRYI